MRQKIKDLFSKLTGKQIVVCILGLAAILWLILCGQFRVDKNGLTCGSNPVDVKVNYDKK